LIVGVGQVLDERQEGSEQGSTDDPSQDQDEQAVASEETGDGHGDDDRRQAEDEGSRFNGQPGASGHHSQRGAKGGPRQDAQQPRRNQGIDEHGLKGGSRNGKRRAREDRGHDPRQADVEQDVRKGTESLFSHDLTTEQELEHNVVQLGQRDGKSSQGERDEYRCPKQAEQQHQDSRTFHGPRISFRSRSPSSRSRKSR